MVRAAVSLGIVSLLQGCCVPWFLGRPVETEPSMVVEHAPPAPSKPVPPILVPPPERTPSEIAGLLRAVPTPIGELSDCKYARSFTGLGEAATLGQVALALEEKASTRKGSCRPIADGEHCEVFLAQPEAWGVTLSFDVRGSEIAELRCNLAG